MPYNPNFQWKRKTITISVPTSSLPAGYQVKIIIPKESEMQSDFRDLRFETIDGYGLSHWLESINTTPNPDEATVWVKLKDIATAPTTVNIYMYYGNPYVASSSNGNTVFSHFTDFSNSNGLSLGAGWSISGGIATFSGVGTNHIYFTTPVTDNRYAFFTRVRRTGASRIFVGCENNAPYDGASETGLGLYGVGGGINNLYRFNNGTGPSGCNTGTTSFTFDLNVWVKAEMIIDEVTPKYIANGYQDGSTTPDRVNECNTKGIGTGNISGWYGVNTEPYQIDYGFIRKYVPFGPSVPTAAQIAGLIAETIPLNSKRKRIIINTTTIPANYQIKLTIPFAPEMNMDFSDLRFVTKNNPTSLSYWIESSTPGVEAIILVKLIDALTATSDYIYMHYGNPNLTSASNVSNTFIREISDVFCAWDLNGDAFDRSGKGNNGTLYGGVGYTAGRTGQAGSFNGSTGYISGSLTGWSGTTASMSAWIKSTDTAVSRFIATTGYWVLFMNRFDAGKFIAIFDGSSADNSGTQDSTTSINTGNWVHIVATNSGTTTKIYVNGSEENSYPETYVSPGSVFNIGASAGPVNLFNGIIEDVRYYNHALTSPEVADLSNNSGYVTTNYAGKELVRKYVATEPSIDYTTAPESMNTFSRRKKITINNNSGAALADYQVPITVAYDSDMQSNFNDIRFVDINNNLLPYWIESYTSSTTATVWIKANLNTGDNIVYMYYGNSSITSASNGNTVFEFFDDAETGVFSDKWNNITGSGFSYSTDYAYSGTKSIKVIGDEYVSVSKITGITDAIFEAMVKSTDDISTSNMLTARASGSANTFYGMRPFYYATNTSDVYKRIAGTFTLLNSVAKASGVATNWNLYSFICVGTTLQVKVNGTLYNNITDSTLSSGGIGLRSTTSGIYVDNVRVRKYAATEPTVTSTGTEENITATSMTITPTSPVGLGTTITVHVTWTSTVETTGFIPRIIIGGNTHLLDPTTLSAGDNIVTFIVTGLPVGIHSICPDPN